MKRWLLVLAILLCAGCENGESKARRLFTVSYVEVDGAHRIMRGQGTCFFVRYGDQHYMVTAVHVVDWGRMESPVPVMGAPVYVGRDAVLYPVAPQSGSVMAGAASHGDAAIMCGYPGEGGYAEVRGTVLAVGYVSALVQEGMSGGPVLVGGRAVGVISQIWPGQGITEYVPLPEALSPH